MNPPKPKAAIRIGFIGAGKLATHLAWALSELNYTVQGAYSRGAASAQALCQPIAARVYDSGQALVDDCDWVFICVPDAAIGACVDALHWGKQHTVIHCSGATKLSVMASAASAGGALAGFHPLRTFSALPASPQAVLAAFNHCTVGLEAHGNTLPTLAYLAQGLGARVIHITADQRALYHAGANYAGAFVTALVKQGAMLWQHLGVSETDALTALLPLLRSTVAALETAQTQGLTVSAATVGPVARGDVATIQAHCEALAKYEPEALPLYAQLSLAVVPLALEKGSLSQRDAKTICEILHKLSV